MLNEIQEFKDYTVFPVYTTAGPKDTSYLGRFTIESMKGFLGFERILTILARGFLFRSGDPYENVDYARRALCAWVSIPDDGKDLAGWEGKFTTCFPELHEEFPKLVDAHGNGWYVQHIRSIIALAEQCPTKMNARVKESVVDKYEDFVTKWCNKVRAMQIPIFLESTDAIWQTRFDDVIANALTLGPLREQNAHISNDLKTKIAPLLPKDATMEHIETLISYYKANKPEDTDWVVLPSSAFNNYFGSTVFSKKVLPKITGVIIQRSEMSHGTGRFRVMEEFL